METATQVPQEFEPTLAPLGVQAALNDLRSLESRMLLLTGSLHIGFHPNYFHQKQNRADKSTLFVYGGDSWNRTNDLMHVKHAL